MTRALRRWPALPLIAACALTGGVLSATPAAAAPYGSNGVFGVTTQPRDGWATTFIPPGRYRVDQSPSMQPYQSPPGRWFRCSNFPCTPTSPENIIGTGAALRDAPTFVDIAPSDVAVALHNVTLTSA
ncbi:hypothetical protein [Mycolicibacterium vaccae]|uniref:Uncharacterized protein n=1 Tax=Mycolicibacterium vaccae ATCC 25954 TaxID=1194972 RepID=K0UUH5_MYCVA|nr:hypothetical protein [Mycolicibacterium vaccae]EJZ06253.1 hypothetical protein MVAC_22445 [Mycolicibacterium vaccae ATCC 25954]MCV7063807.1 hypothetical protein [Mycolicibacterium vaccae]